MKLSPPEQSAVDAYEADMREMDLQELQSELTSVTATIDDETSWQEALIARIKQIT